MPLTDAQIARYSRQIIVPNMGGRAQERLLSSRIVLIGTREDIAQPLAYLVGAGVGDIDLCVPGTDDPALRSLCEQMRELNPDSTVSYGSLAQSPDLVFALMGNPAIVDFTAAEAPSVGAAVIARLDAPGKIAILPAPPPCLRCAACDLLATFGERTDRAGFIAMLATTEALRALSAVAQETSASLITFDGYESNPQPLLSARPDCACSRVVSR